MDLQGKKVLIDLDSGILARIERERLVTERTVGKRPPRTSMIRTLLTEAMNGRCTGRGEEIPLAQAAEPESTEQVSEG